ncbi:MAG TPA: high-potential iron-sulfur protein [Ignavibacteriaceae bacterium]|nr:high-potential iron-sulfur protein [Ignavibacteriaceae bacterium]
MEKINRKDFLIKIFFSGLAATGFGFFINSCSENKTKPAETKPSDQRDESKNNDPCNDINDLTQQERQVREAYQYTSKSSKPGQNCANCNYYQIANPGETCGTCQVVKGPINPKGHCTIWTKKLS